MKGWKHALVTGAASGLGLAFAIRLLRRGTSVSALDRHMPNQARQALDQAAATGGTTWGLHIADVTDEHTVVQAVNTAATRFGSFDLTLHSAGVVLNRTLASTSTAEFRRVIDVNLLGTFHVVKAALAHMQAGSRLALIASMAGLTSNYGYAAYGTSKYGVVGLATTLRYEYEARGIHVSCICPPEIRTPMVAYERRPGNSEALSLKLKDIAGSLEVDPAVDAMLSQLDRGRWLIIPGFKAKTVAAIYRFVPSLHFAVVHRIVTQALRKQVRN